MYDAYASCVACARMHAPVLSSCHLRTCELASQRVSLPTMARVRLRLAAGLAVSLVTTSLAVNGLVRVLEVGIEKSGDDDDQWKHVRAHEERFIAALRSGTSAEGDDAGV